MSNINSFAQNINLTIKSLANQLALLTAMQKAVAENNSVVNYEYTDTEGNTMKYQLPSYESVINRLQAVEESLNSLASGKGTINLNDGTRRTVQVSSIPTTPSQITGLTDPTTFTVDSNWFFEELMFPGAQVSIDLTDLIEDSADRVKVTRIILSTNNDASRQIWENDLSVNSYDYVSLKTILSNNGISYYEDEEIVDLPLVSNTVAGSFQITSDPTTKNGDVWYYLDSITYSTISSNGTDQGLNNILSVGDMLLYNDSIFKITNVNQNDKAVVLSRVSGVQTPGVYSIFTIYTDPFASKIVNVRFGAHEYDILYFKGVTEAYNLLADSWSTPVKFSTDELILDGTSGQQEQSFASYYAQYIMDWGSKMIAETKEHKIAAWSGNIPNTPSLNSDDFRVVQINTQINAAIDTTDAKNTASEIESVKSQISSLKSTIAAQKTDLQSAVNLYTYNSIQQQIATNTTDLNNLQTTYSTLVDSFQTLVKENSAVTTEPKYHIRGFFPIPEYKYQDEENNIQEEIIGFDIAYRYIREDSTATQLNTFTYTNSDGTEVTGTFTDWVVETGPMKTKVYDEDLARYVWKAENVADGTETNINQIDIAINKGEQVEIKVRSISECGYPENPLRSDWSNSITMSFPSTLATSNEIADLITMVNDDALNISITNMLDSTGVTTHLDDTIPNTNSVNGMYYKHTADNIAYEETGTSTDGTTVTNSISLQDKISQLFTLISDNTIQMKTNRNDIDSLISSESEHYEENSSNIKNLLTDTLDISTHVGTVETKIDSILDSDGYVATEKLILKNENDEEDIALSSLNQSELFIINNHDGTNKDLADIHVRYVYLHPDSATTSLRYNVAELITDVSILVAQNIVSIELINASIDDISTKIIDIAYISDVDKVQDSLTTLESKVTKVIDGDNATVTDLYVGTSSDSNDNRNTATGTRLSGNSGNLQVYKGESTQLGTIEVEDITVNDRKVSDLITSVDDNTENIATATTNISDINTKISGFAYKSASDTWTLQAATGSFTNINVDSDATIKNLIINNTVFKPTYSQSNSGMIASAIFSDVTVYTNGVESGDSISMTGLNETIQNLENEYQPEINKVSAIITSDGETYYINNVNEIGTNSIATDSIRIGDGVVLRSNGDVLNLNNAESTGTFYSIKVDDVIFDGTKSLKDTYTTVTNNNETVTDYEDYIKGIFGRDEDDKNVTSVDIKAGTSDSLTIRTDTENADAVIRISADKGSEQTNPINTLKITSGTNNATANINLGTEGILTCKQVNVWPSDASQSVNLVDMLLSATAANQTLSTIVNINHKDAINLLIEVVKEIRTKIKLIDKDNAISFDVTVPSTLS